MESSSTAVTLVGNRFAGFAIMAGVETIDSFLAALASPTPAPAPMVVRAGQGVDEAEWERLIGRAQRYGRGRMLQFEQFEPQLVGQHEAHKRRADNMLLADLAESGPDTYSAALRVHNDNELLLDHQTGLHVQGMVCVEAARQMFLAVTERYIASAVPDVDYYYVINTMNTTFENFLFPTPAEVRMTVLAVDQGDTDRLACEAEISIHQAGRCASRTYVSYTAFKPEILAPSESRRADRAAAFAVAGSEIAA